MTVSLPLASNQVRYDFRAAMHDAGSGPLVRSELTTLQINVGKLCNQACHHCHVDAGPKRTEIMTPKVVDKILSLLASNEQIELVDLTGGAPELNPDFRRLVTGARALGRTVIDRCNLTVLFEPGQEDLAVFLTDQQVEITASLPCYSEDNVDKQRGKGVFEKSIAALRALNQLGYGIPNSGLVLNLVYNPVGVYLPPSQAALQADYKRELDAQFGIQFNELFTITNMPIKRFAHFLEREGKLDEYMSLLINHFNPATVQGLMCRSLLSIAYDGALYDCDFNQMLEIDIGGGDQPTVFELDDLSTFTGRPIATDSHCFGCTAGAGSSCGGALE